MRSPRHSEPAPVESALGVVIGGLGPMVAAALLVAVRTDIEHTTAVLLLVVVVIAGAAVGGRLAGAVAAVSAAASFDFFLTHPYLSLRIDSEADVETTLVLLVIGLLVGEIVVRARRHRQAAEQSRGEIERLRRIAQLAAAGSATSADLVHAVEEELVDLLALQNCWFVWGELPGRFPRLTRSGTVATSRHVFSRTGEFELPAEGVELPVVRAGETIGQMVLMPRPGVGVPLEARIVAGALADQLGAVLTSVTDVGSAD